MKYMLMMNAPGGPYQVSDWSKDDLDRHIAFMMDLNQDLAGSGELVAGEGLAGPDQARLVRADDDGLPVTDGVFPESKEFLAGFWIVDVETPERADRIAARISTAPGPGGRPLYLKVEVRQVMSGPPEELP